jgi:hypothetical protein
MPEEKLWWILDTGVAEVAVFSTYGNFMKDRPEVENYTKILLTPQGVGLRKLAERAIMNFDNVIAIFEADPALVSDLSNAWDGGGNGNIKLPTDKDRRMFGGLK